MKRERSFGKHSSTMERDVNGLSELGGSIVGIGEFDEDSELDAWFNPINTDITGHRCAPKLDLLEGQAGGGPNKENAIARW